jgi:membrane protein DedA with SNARE-associated domain
MKAAEIKTANDGTLMGMDIESIILGTSYAGIFLLMTVNGFASFPSSQILYIVVGYFIFTGYLLFLPASLLGALGNAFGNLILYELVRRYGIGALKKFRIYRESEIRKVEIVFRKRGAWFVFIGKLLPAIKVFVPIMAALGKLRRSLFILLMFAASWIWACGFIAIGFIFGKSADVFKAYAFILLLVAGTVVYLFYRYLNSPEILRVLDGGPSSGDDSKG